MVWRNCGFPRRTAGKTNNLGEVPEPSTLWYRLTAVAVKAVLAGRGLPELPRLDLSRGTEFQRSVWAALRKNQTGADAKLR